eukprot:TRINITY_DN104909_c0_g1_i1.p1 TRINITY_DN104909_c0_g1~~TRINITY_DN104909_c0_g1_i1.p1  ORF type:complete len:519 (+),score=334.36 TRINITY_DN104909_c0_g1_i1:111-1667(+)
MALDFTEIKDIAGLVAGARAAFDSGRTMSIRWRKQQLLKLRDLIKENELELQEAVKKDLHKPAAECNLTELGMALNDIAYHYNNIDAWTAPEKVSQDVPFIQRLDNPQIRRDPLGLVLIIGAWNYPFQLTLVPLIGAITGGNCAIIKPSEVSPHSAQLLAELLPRYLDAEAFRVINGDVPVTTEVLKQRYDHILYTGGGFVGKIILRAAAEHLTPVTLELGGKSPCYIDDDCDFRVVARRLIWGRLMNAGQTCIAPDYVLCSKRAEDKLVPAIKAALADFYGDNPKQSNDLSRIVNDRHFRRVKAFVDGSNVRNGKVVIGGDTDEKEKYVAPTVLTDVDPQSPVMTDEIFGPVLPIVTVDAVDEAIKFINARDKPLALYVFSNTSKTCEKVLKLTSSGSAVVNDTLMQAGCAQLPFGGVGGSGMGAYHGKHSFDTFTHVKAVLYKNQGLEAVNAVRYPPYSERKTSLITKLMVGTPKTGLAKYSSYFVAAGVAVAAVAYANYVDPTIVDRLTKFFTKQ